MLAEWLTATRQEGSIAQAYISERRGDDPRTIGRIAVVEPSNSEPSFLVYSPTGSTLWLVGSGRDWRELQRFRTLRAALNSIRPVLDDLDAGQPELSSSFAP